MDLLSGVSEVLEAGTPQYELLRPLFPDYPGFLKIRW